MNETTKWSKSYTEQFPHDVLLQFPASLEICESILSISIINPSHTKNCVSSFCYSLDEMIRWLSVRYFLTQIKLFGEYEVCCKQVVVLTLFVMGSNSTYVKKQKFRTLRFREIKISGSQHITPKRKVQPKFMATS